MLCGVLLLIFLPRANAAVAYSNLQNTSQLIVKQDKHDKTIDYYTQCFLDSPYALVGLKEQLSALNNLQKSLVLGTSFSLSALMYTAPKEDFRAVVKVQNGAVANFNAAITNLQKYCENQVFALFENITSYSNPASAVNEMLSDAYLKKYRAVVEYLAQIGLQSAKIINTSATPCIEVNPKMKTAHLNLVTDIHTLANSVCTLAQTTTVLSRASDLYTEYVYLSYFN